MKDNLSKKDLSLLKKSLRNILIVIIYYFIILNRPTFKKYSPDVIDFLLNTLPNFSAGIVGTIAFYEYIQHYRNRLLFSIMISGIWLTTEEYYPVFSHNLYFDYWDIFMSWFGCGLSASFILFRRFKKIF